MVAAQLYASHRGPAAAKGKKKAGSPAPRRILLLATADGLGPRFLFSAGRYTQGALLAPVFFPDESDPLAGPFVTRFREQFTDEPTVADALAYDATRALALALDEIAQAPDSERRAQLAARLRSSKGEGLTGDLGFGDDGERRGDPRLFCVEGEAIHLVRK